VNMPHTMNMHKDRTECHRQRRIPVASLDACDRGTRWPTIPPSYFPPDVFGAPVDAIPSSRGARRRPSPSSAAGYSFGASSDARSVTIDAEKRKSVPTIESPGVAGSCSGSPPSRASPLLTCPYATRCEQAEPKKTPLKALVMRRSWVRIPSRAPGDFTFEGSSDHGFTRRAPREDGRRRLLCPTGRPPHCGRCRVEVDAGLGAIRWVEAESSHRLALAGDELIDRVNRDALATHA